MKRYDVCSPREFEKNGEVKTTWIRVGVAFDREDGKPPSILLDASPYPGKDGLVKLMLFEPKEKDQGGGGSSHGGKGGGSTQKQKAPENESDIPF